MTDDFEQSATRRIEQVRAAAAEHRLLIVALLINSSLYLSGAFIAGLVLHNHTAMICALASAGACYLAPMWQLMTPTDKFGAGALVGVSIILGVAAGLALLIGG